jgi:heat shock protein HslJ
MKNRTPTTILVLTLGVLILNACTSTLATRVNPVEQAGLRDTVKIDVVEFNTGNVENEPYIRRMTITDPQILDQILNTLDTNLRVTLKLACIPEYELHFHLRDGTVQTFGYSCHGTSFIRGEQDFWEGEDYAPPEQFDALIEEQLTLNPREPIPARSGSSEEIGPPGTSADLADTKWELILLNDNSLIKDTEITLNLEGMFLGGFMGCNGYGGGPDSGKYTATDDGTLRIAHPIAVTVQLCSTPEGIMEQEAAYIKSLQSSVAYQVINDHLEIMNASGEITLVFARKE